MIVEKLPPQLRNSHGAWALRVCKDKRITDCKVAKIVITLAISLSLAPTDLNISQDMASELLQVIGSERHEPFEVSEVYPLINQTTRIAIASCILHFIETCIFDMDWTLKKLKIFCSVTQKITHFNQNEDHASELAFEENIYSRAESVVTVLASFVLMRLKGTYAI